MMSFLKIITVASLGLFLLTGCMKSGRGSFQIEDPVSHELSGPYDYVDGENLYIDGKLYYLRTGDVKNKKATTNYLLNRTVLPTASFDNALLNDVLQYIASSTHGGINEPRVAIILSDDELSEKTVTLRVDEISLKDLLDVVCKATDCVYEVDDNGVVFVKSE